MLRQARLLPAHRKSWCIESLAAGCVVIGMLKFVARHWRLVLKGWCDHVRLCLPRCTDYAYNPLTAHVRE
jgi:hypothetical protein